MKEQLEHLIKHLDKTQWWPLSKLELAQEKELANVVKHHAVHTEHFKQRLQAHGLNAADVSTLTGLTKLKPFTKRDIQLAGDAFNSAVVPPSHLPVSISQSSGSTGQPVTVKRTMISELFWGALAVRDHQWYNRDYKGKLTAIRVLQEYKQVEQWGSPVSLLYGSGSAQAIPVSTDIKEQVRLLKTFQPNIIIVHAGALAAIVEEWARDGYSLTNLEHIKNVGDTVRQPLRDRVREVTGLEIEDNYSSSEVGCIAIQCPSSGLYHIMSESLIVEILNEDGAACQEGEVGRVVVTDLYNAASPIIRYDLGDHAEVGGTCSCGRHSPTIKRVLGRDRNLLNRPDGTRFWPPGGRKTLEKYNVKQWQIIQYAVDHLEYRIVRDEPLTEEQHTQLTAEVNSMLKFPGTIRLVEMTEIPLSKSGKYEESICLIKETQ
jgi:phenylacetate-CoA ligase